MTSCLRVVIALSILVLPLAAQSTASAALCAGGVVATTLPGSLAEENRRAAGLRAGARWSLQRGATDAARERMTQDSSAAPFRAAFVLPELLITSQSAFPMPANDGPMWAGKGLSYSVTGGIAFCGKAGRWGAIIAPTYWYAENADFPLPNDPRFVPARKGEYSPWASTYHYLPRELDQPRRFGDRAIAKTEMGAIALWYRTSRADIGFTSEAEWWGPGQQNALILSAQSSGIPRVYVRTVKPIAAAGELDARMFLGALSFSPFFKSAPTPDVARTLAGISLVWRPKFERGLSVGAARLVSGPITGNAWVRHVFDAIASTPRPNAYSRQDSTPKPGLDQLFSVFADWRLADDGTEIWAEWARAELPANVRDFFDAPNHTQALTIGLQHVRPMRWKGWNWRVAVEHSQTDQSSTFRERPTGSWYTSRAVSGGFTQKGQVLGAVIGPGSSAQWIGFDLAGPRHSAGFFLSRIKWDDDALLAIPRPNGNGLCKHDVSLAWGVRGSTLTGAGWIEGMLTATDRLNLYWQALGLCFDNSELQIDKHNLSLEFRFHPRIH
jgi:hypothetical protein